MGKFLDTGVHALILQLNKHLAKTPTLLDDNLIRRIGPFQIIGYDFPILVVRSQTENSQPFHNLLERRVSRYFCRFHFPGYERLIGIPFEIQ